MKCLYSAVWYFSLLKQKITLITVESEQENQKLTLAFLDWNIIAVLKTIKKVTTLQEMMIENKNFEL